MVTYLYLFNQTSIYYAESLDTIGDNLKEVKPNMFTTVPRLLEKVYDKIMQKGNDLAGIKRKLFFWAHSLAEKFEINKNQGLWYNLQLSIANKLIWWQFKMYCNWWCCLPSSSYTNIYCRKNSDNGRLWTYGNITCNFCKQV